MPGGSGSLQLNVRYDVVRPGISAIADTLPASSVGGGRRDPARSPRFAVEPNGSGERSTAVPTRTNLAPSVAVSRQRRAVHLQHLAPGRQALPRQPAAGQPDVPADVVNPAQQHDAVVSRSVRYSTDAAGSPGAMPARAERARRSAAA